MSVPERFSVAEEQLHQEAVAATGLEDFGDSSYREGLQVLLASYDDTARFGDLGRYSTWAMLVNCLRGRLYAVDGIKRHAACRTQQIKRPLFIVGLPRTGTTILHRLLSARDGNQGLEYWLGSFPKPRPARSRWQDDPLYCEIDNSLAALDSINPELKKIHEMSAAGVDECRLLLMQSFANVTFQANATVPAYEQWLYRADMRAVYALYADTLKLIGHNEADRRWVLKDPSHLWALDVVLEQFPDAVIIQTHRDPVKLIPSVCSLVLTARRMQEPEVDPALVGASELHQWDTVLRRGMEVRSRYPDRFVDLYFEDFVRDPAASVATIFQQLGEEMEESEVVAVRKWMAENPQHKHGSHRYRPEDFGLSAGQIGERFAHYREFFDIQRA